MGPPISAEQQYNNLQTNEKNRWDLNIEPWPDHVEPSNVIQSVPSYIDLFPTKFSWQIPGLSQSPPGNNYWGGNPYIHMAILKKWHTEYGADLVVCSGATYELQVSRPPTTKEAAIKLAVEHYLYCQDCVTQTSLPDTIKHRAARILNARTWYFWWD
jgi:hypothetical protein